MRIVIIIASLISLSIVANAVDSTPEGINSAVQQLTSAINDQTARISALDSDLYTLANKNEAAQLDSAIQNIGFVQNNLATSQEVANLKNSLDSQASSVNEALAIANSAAQVMNSDAPDNVASLSSYATGNLEIMKVRDELIHRADNELTSSYTHLENSIKSSLDTLEKASETIDTAAELVNTLLDWFNVAENVEEVVEAVALSHGYSESTHAVVFRWKYFSSATWTTTSSTSYTWLAGNDASAFGGSGYFNPNDWADSYPYAYEFQYDANAMLSIRSLCTETSYGSSMTNAISHAERMNTAYDAQSGNFVITLRIKNTKTTTVTHRFLTYYTSYGSYEQYFSVALNGNNLYTTSGNCDQCTYTATVSFPADRVSTLMFISTAGYLSSYKRPTSFGIYENTMNLPQGLMYVDDLDSAPNSIA